MKTSDKIKIMNQYLDGIDIEYRKIGHNFIYYTLTSIDEGGTPVWNWGETEYRVKINMPEIIVNIAEDGYIKKYDSISEAYLDQDGYYLIGQYYILS